MSTEMSFVLNLPLMSNPFGLYFENKDKSSSYVTNEKKMEFQKLRI